MLHGKYVGNHPDLQGESALLQESEDPELWLAQFDNLTKLVRRDANCNLALGWHPFKKTEFEIDVGCSNCLYVDFEKGVVT